MRKIHFDEIDSTNAYLERNYMNFPDLTVVSADVQTAGRGRLNREWNSGKGGLWFSILFRNPELSPATLQRICSVVSVEVLMRLTEKREFGLKWPNDIYYRDRKISGCLQKNIFSGGESACIVGTGININNEIPAELSGKGISLKQIAGKAFNCSEILDTILIDVERGLVDYDENEFLNRYRDYSIIRPGSEVTVKRFEDERIMTGKVLEHPIDEIRLFIEDEEVVYRAGDITLKDW
ncbi:MAG TPA: biotin--[acetyl-CoA-carboxylase] ligase [Thermotogota bacterium]|nr:biotin--[acetyl-CoA-carboxylase] ligase [Thermotogota bacterium]